MKSLTPIKILFLFTALLFISGLLHTWGVFYKAPCGGLLRLSDESRKINTIKIWFDKNIKNQVFLEKTGVAGWVDSNSDREYFYSLSFDWAFIDIDPKYARLLVMRPRGKRSEFLDEGNIIAYGLGVGRNFLLINISGSDIRNEISRPADFIERENLLLICENR